MIRKGEVCEAIGLHVSELFVTEFNVDLSNKEFAVIDAHFIVHNNSVDAMIEALISLQKHGHS